MSSTPESMLGSPQINNEDSIQEEANNGVSSFLKALAEKAYKCGQEAKRKGFERLNPYYGKYEKTREYFFYCGFDGVSFEEALEYITEKAKELDVQVVSKE